ncbi:uncharacterized protein JCM10292_003838 [Rhodotorula paludigena]|uniref:uncharacterized protein n=1 Tax=Rhodotorula paludigena TaxID=86838 RepID=UPI00317ED7E8
MTAPSAFKAGVDPVPPSSTNPFTAAWDELRRPLKSPIRIKEVVRLTVSKDEFVLKPPAETHSSRGPTAKEVATVSPLVRISSMNDYVELIFRQTDRELRDRDLDGERDEPIRLRPLVDPKPDELGDDDARAISYSTEQGLTDALGVLLNGRAGKVLSLAVGRNTCFARTNDTIAATDLSDCLRTTEPPRITIEIKLETVLSDQDFEEIVAIVGKGELDFHWPSLDEKAQASKGDSKPQVSKEPWGAFLGEQKLDELDGHTWRPTFDSVLFQLYAQISAAKAVSAHLDQVQLDRTCGLLTNGRKWLVLSEKDGVAYVSPFVLDSEEHAVAAVLTALVLGAMTPSAKHGAGASDHAHEGDDEPAAKRQKGERRILRALADEVVPGPKVTFVEPATPPPRTPSPPPLPVETVRHAQVLSFRFQDLWKREKSSQDLWFRATSSHLSRRVRHRHEADPLPVPTVNEPPELTFRMWSRFRFTTLVFVYRSTDLQYALKRVNCVILDDLDGYAAAEELFCEAGVLEHLEQVAPSLAGVFFPHFLGLWTPVGDRALCGLMTAWFGEPIERHSLEYLQSLDPMGTLDQLHSLGVAHGDIHRSNLRLVSSSPSTEPSSPPSTSSATDRSPPSRRHKLAFLDFGRSVLEEDLTSEQWESAKAGDRRALRRTLTPNGLVL